MHLVSEMKSISNLDYKHFMTVVSLKMSDEPNLNVWSLDFFVTI